MGWFNTISVPGGWFSFIHWSAIMPTNENHHLAQPHRHTDALPDNSTKISQYHTLYYIIIIIIMYAKFNIQFIDFKCQ